MKYEDGFKASVVQDLRDSREPISAVARRNGVAPSTLVRWDAQSGDPVKPAQPIKSPEAELQMELDDLLQRLDRASDENRLTRHFVRHNRRVAWLGRAGGGDLVSLLVADTGRTRRRLQHHLQWYAIVSSRVCQLDRRRLSGGVASRRCY